MHAHRTKHFLIGVDYNYHKKYSSSDARKYEYQIKFQEDDELSIKKMTKHCWTIHDDNACMIWKIIWRIIEQ